jgi:hypothetical protein
MNERKRLYPTVAEDREREHLKRQLGLEHTALAKGGGMPQRTSRKEVLREEVPRKEKPRREEPRRD